jgi:NTE family protein
LAQANKDSITYKNLVFEGAGIRGLAYCGALMEMDDRGLLDSVERVAGTSSGAITATLLAVGYSPQEVFDIISSTNFAKFNDGGGFFVGGLIRLNRRMGYYKGKSFTKWMCQLLESKMGNGNLTFSELHDLKVKKPSQYRDLIITATCMNHQKPEFFSWTSYPHMFHCIMSRWSWMTTAPWWTSEITKKESTISYWMGDFFPITPSKHLMTLLYIIALLIKLWVSE